MLQSMREVMIQTVVVMAIMGIASYVFIFTGIKAIRADKDITAAVCFYFAAWILVAGLVATIGENIANEIR